MPKDTASGSALALLQHTAPGTAGSETEAAAREIMSYHTVIDDQRQRIARLEEAYAYLVTILVDTAPNGGDRSNALTLLRQSKFMATAAIALEGR